MQYSEKLSALRAQLAGHTVDAYLQPVHDEFMSEYPPESTQRVKWLTGFAGSAGMVAVTRNAAAIFVDGRYTLQAKNEVDGTLYEQHNSGEKSAEAWVLEKLCPPPDLPPQAGGGNFYVGYDAMLFTQAMVKRAEALLAKKNITLKPVTNLVDAIWKDRPVMPASKAQVHEMIYAGQESAQKRAQIAKAVSEAGADAAMLVAPDSVCWLLNIRGRDVENTPFLLAPAIIDSTGKVTLFIDPARVDAAVAKHLGSDVSAIAPTELKAELAKLGKAKKTVLCDTQSVPVWYVQQLKDSGAQIVEAFDPCQLPKACKNAAEIAAIQAAHIRDGAAVIKLLCWLDKETASRSVTEMEVADKLLALRGENNLFVEPSFPTIAGSGPNGAIVHYRASEKSNRTLKANELFLLDSGGQYLDGTTDITRTTVIGKPTPEQKDRFTRVLKGHIAIATAQFPEGVSGSQLDSLARQYLWQAGLDYDHGTGHGVGQYLSVHEGPQRISKRGGDTALKPGMVLSNEPGYYKAGEYGIRIENLVTVVERTSSEGKKFFGFDTLTCVPIDTRLVDVTMLSAEEKGWLNEYHAWVLESQRAALSGAEAAWLTERCKPL